MVFVRDDHPFGGDGAFRQHLRAHRREGFAAVGSGIATGAASLWARLLPDPPAVDAELLPVGWTPDLDEDEVA